MKTFGPDSLSTYISVARRYTQLNYLTDVHLAWLWDYGFYIFDVLHLRPQPRGTYDARTPFQDIPERMEE